MATKKVYLAGMGPYLVDDTLEVDDPDGDWSGELDVGVRTDSLMVATEFHGIPISSISVADVDDPSDELNLLSASTVGGLVSVYEAIIPTLSVSSRLKDMAPMQNSCNIDFLSIGLIFFIRPRYLCRKFIGLSSIG